MFKKNKNKIGNLHAISFGLAGGIVWGVGLLLATLIAAGTGYGVEFVDILRFYPGYSVTFVGATVGFIWGFIDGFVGCAVFAWLYNRLQK